MRGRETKRDTGRKGDRKRKGGMEAKKLGGRQRRQRLRKEER